MQMMSTLLVGFDFEIECLNQSLNKKIEKVITDNELIEKCQLNSNIREYLWEANESEKRNE